MNSNKLKQILMDRIDTLEYNNEKFSKINSLKYKVPENKIKIEEYKHIINIIIRNDLIEQYKRKIFYKNILEWFMVCLGIILIISLGILYLLILSSIPN